MPIRSLALWILLSLALAATPASADDRLELAGLRFDLFGGWAYGKTGEHQYLDATSGGQAEKADLHLAARHELSESTGIFTQLELTDHSGDGQVEIDFLAFDWRPSPNVSWRFGRTQQPFGIYSEFYDLGTDRPFYDLPQGLYGPTEIVSESLDGVSFGLRRDLGAGELRLDAYTGRIRFAATEPWEAAGAANAEVEEEKIVRDRTLGFRLEWQSGGGLTVGVSAFRGEDRHRGDTEEFAAAVAGGAHLVWERGPWLLRAEAARLEEKGNLEVEAGYLELARRFGGPWQGALRWDRSTTQVEEADLEQLGAELGEHRDVAAGISYWFSSGLVLKLSHHWVEGQRFVKSESLGDPDEKSTRMIRLGLQFHY